MRSKKNCLSYWYPKLRDAGIPTPNTAVLQITDDLTKNLFEILDGKDNGSLKEVANSLRALVELGKFTFPIFLRTGQTSGKHEWKNTCYVTDPANFEKHIARLINFSACCDFLGLPFDIWAIREMLPTKPIAVLPEYDDFPLTREKRLFIRDGDLVCMHAYWPPGAIKDGFNYKDGGTKPLPSNIDEIIEKATTFKLHEIGEIEYITRTVADVFEGDGAWSVDILETEKGWFVTDMAVAANSWHDWPDCPNKFTS